MEVEEKLPAHLVYFIFSVRKRAFADSTGVVRGRFSQKAGYIYLSCAYGTCTDECLRNNGRLSLHGTNFFLTYHGDVELQPVRCELRVGLIWTAVTSPFLQG